jgi:Putative adhesin
MPTFATPQPISVTVELGVGHLTMTATDRRDTEVDVQPSDPAKPGDVEAAEQTRAEYADGVLLIREPTGRRQWTLRGGRESIDVRIGLPAGSHLRGRAGVVALHCTGRLGQCQFTTGVGDIDLHQAGPVELKTGAGDITVRRSTDRTGVTTGSGAVRIGTIDGIADVKNANGDTWIGEVTGDIRLSSANGSIAVERSHASVGAKTANGDIRLDELAGGPVIAQTARGRVDIAIRPGVAAWLDLDTKFGSVRNDLAASEQPASGERRTEIRARTGYGDIAVRHAVTEQARGEL